MHTNFHSGRLKNADQAAWQNLIMEQEAVRSGPVWQKNPAIISAH
jgi:hypothetical protein